jgi:predicted phage tail protein
LIVFLLYRIPGVWEKVDFTQAPQGENEGAGGAAAIVSGLLAFSIQYWMAGTHTMNNGINYGDAFHTSMTIFGLALVFGGLGLIISTKRKSRISHGALLEKNHS